MRTQEHTCSGRRLPMTREERAERASAIAKETEAIKQEFSYLNLLAPNGKRIRECTFEELIACGGWFALIGDAGATKHGKHQIASTFYSNDELAKFKR